MTEIPVEIERKFVILMPSESLLSSYPSHTVSRIEQTYLAMGGGKTLRVRKRDFGDRVEYTLNEKTRIDGMSAYENESEITSLEYESMLCERLSGTVTLRKTRHTFSWSGLTVEIDIYPEWKYTAILETELPSRDACPSLPEELRVIAEVTGNAKYSNAAMSHTFPEELI